MSWLQNLSAWQRNCSGKPINFVLALFSSRKITGDFCISKSASNLCILQKKKKKEEDFHFDMWVEICPEELQFGLLEERKKEYEWQNCIPQVLQKIFGLGH